jgi:hypothetical protein
MASSSIDTGLLVLFLSLAPSASLATPVVVVAQAGSVMASASHPDGTPSEDMDSAPDHGDFSVRASARSGPTGDPAQVLVRLRSMLHDDAIHMLVDGFALESVAGGGEASGSSLYDVTFDLTVASVYDLNYRGIVGEFNDTGGTLSDAAGILIELLPETDRTGILEPGRYRLEIFASGRAAPSEMEGLIHQHLDLLFTPIPEPSAAALVAAGLAALRLARGSARRR